MNEEDFEGSLVLEKIAEIGKTDDFFNAIDEDNFKEVRALMKKAGLDAQNIAIVLKKLREANGNE